MLLSSIVINSMIQESNDDVEVTGKVVRIDDDDGAIAEEDETAEVEEETKDQTTTTATSSDSEVIEVHDTFNVTIRESNMSAIAEIDETEENDA